MAEPQGTKQISPHKRTKVKNQLTRLGWHRYPATFAVMMDHAEKVAKTSPTMTAANIATVVVHMYHQHAAGKMEGELNS